MDALQCFPTGEKSEQWIEARRNWAADDRSPEVTSGVLPPENDESPSLSVALSGGGMRSFALATGQMRALTDRYTIRYLSASSGGAWFALSYWCSEGDVATELGDITAPGDLRLKDLRRPTGRLRQRAATSIGKVVHDKLIKRLWLLWKRNAFQKALETTIEETFELGDRSLARRRKDRPYVIVGITVLGERNKVPFEETERRYRCLEASPLCFGVPGFVETAGGRLQGGWIETRTMGATRRGHNDPLDAFLVPEHVSATTLATYAGMAHADFICSHQHSPFQSLGRLLTAVSVPIWCQDDNDNKRNPVDFVVGDGGIVDNLNLLPLARRDGVRDILALCNFETPLNSLSWDARSRPPEYNAELGSCLDVDASLASYFGINVVPDSDRVGYFLKYNQCFEQSAFASLITRLQASAAVGCGAVAAIDLTTVRNVFYGVPAGLRKRLIVVYLGRCENWESQIKDPVLRKYLVPDCAKEHDGDEMNVDKTHLVDNHDDLDKESHTPFPRFPHLAASGASAPPFDHAAVNLLASFGGFIIKDNLELIEAIREKPFGFFKPEDNAEFDETFPASFFPVGDDDRMQERVAAAAAKAAAKKESGKVAGQPQHSIQRERKQRKDNPVKNLDALIDGR